MRRGNEELLQRLEFMLYHHRDLKEIMVTKHCRMLIARPEYRNRSRLKEVLGMGDFDTVRKRLGLTA